MKKIVIPLIILCLWGLLLPEDADLRVIVVSGPRGRTIRYRRTIEELPDGGHKATYRILPLTVYYYLAEAELLDDIVVFTLDLTYELNTEHPAFETGQEIGIDMLKPHFILDTYSFIEINNPRVYKGGYVLEEGEFILDEQHKSKSVTLKQFWSYPVRAQLHFPFQVKYEDYPLETVNLVYVLPSNLERLEGKHRDEQKLEFRLEGN